MSSRLMARALYRLIRRPGANGADVAKNFFHFARRNHIEYSVRNVLAHLAREHARRAREESLRIVAPRIISPGTFENIRSYVGANTDAPVEISIDEALVGGFIADFAGKTYDASMQTQLRLLENHLSS